MAERPYALSIAGIDPSAGAGLLADVKTFEQLEVYGLGIPSANTIQTEGQFFTNKWLTPSYIMEGVKCMLSTYRVKAVKVGIIENDTVLMDITSWVKKASPDTLIIWDPVMTSSTAHQFQDSWQLSPGLLKNIDIITPNKNEWEKMEPSVKNKESLSIILKGGHNELKTGYDILLQDGEEIEIPPQTTLQLSSKHGSGCVYSSALAAFLAMGENILSACTKAKLYTEKFLASNNQLLGYHHGETTLHFAG